MLNRSVTGALALALIVGAAGCGSSGSKSSSGNGGAPIAPSSSTAASSATPAGDNGEASKSPTQILADVAAAIRDSHGYTMQGSITQRGQKIQLAVSSTSPTTLHMAIATGGKAAELITLPSAAYIRANHAFWNAQAPTLADRLADHWIKVPLASAGGVSSSLGAFAPSTLSRCLVENHGTLSLAGKTTVNGQSAIILKDAGDAPGASAGTLDVAATGPPYPIQFTITGDQRGGGKVDVCNDGKPSTGRGTLSFTQFGHVPPIQAPKGALQLGSGA